MSAAPPASCRPLAPVAGASGLWLWGICSGRGVSPGQVCWKPSRPRLNAWNWGCPAAAPAAGNSGHGRRDRRHSHGDCRGGAATMAADMAATLLWELRTRCPVPGLQGGPCHRHQLCRQPADTGQAGGDGQSRPGNGWGCSRHIGARSGGRAGAVLQAGWCWHSRGRGGSRQQDGSWACSSALRGLRAPRSPSARAGRAPPRAGRASAVTQMCHWQPSRGGRPDLLSALREQDACARFPVCGGFNRK